MAPNYGLITTLARSLQLTITTINLISNSVVMILHSSSNAQNALTEQDKIAEGIIAIALLWGILGMSFHCLLGRRMDFAIVNAVLDIAFVGCFIAVVTFTKGAGSCLSQTVCKAQLGVLVLSIFDM